MSRWVQLPCKPSTKFIPELCEKIRKENPSLKLHQIRWKVEDECRDYWTQQTIRNAFPQWLRDPPSKYEIERMSKRMKHYQKIMEQFPDIHIPTVQKMTKLFVVVKQYSIYPDDLYDFKHGMELGGNWSTKGVFSTEKKAEEYIKKCALWEAEDLHPDIPKDELDGEEYEYHYEVTALDLDSENIGE